MSPSVALAMQQYERISSCLPAYHVRTLTGNDKVELWTDQKLWDATLTNVHVVVGTPAVLADALHHGFVDISRLSLCIFDEAHRCAGNSPMNVIMSRFYWRAKEQSRPVPHILGLTASPVLNNKHGSLEKIEANLDSITVTPKTHRLELEKFVNPPTLSTVVNPRAELEDPLQTGPLCRNLTEATIDYNLTDDPYILELLELNDERDGKRLEKVMQNRKTYCSEQLRALNVRASSLVEQLGVTMAHWYISTCVERFREGIFSDTVIISHTSEKERRHLSAIFDSIESKSNVLPQPCSSMTGLQMTQKAVRLVDILKSLSASSVRGIIFVEQRVVVTCLGRLLGQLPELSGYKIGCFVGTSTSSSRKSTVADLVALKDQQKDLDDFRDGRKNLIIATNVLEEGIDVSACNLCICFDPPKNLVSFVQRRGRARQRGSQYFVFVAEDDMKANPTKWTTLEDEMRKTYMDETRENVEEEQEDTTGKMYEIANTGAVLTLDNAKAHLHHFCDIGIHRVSNYVDLRPEFDAAQNPTTEAWKASVSLPSFVHPDLRYAESAQTWKSETNAIKEAAFECYVALHKAGLVNDNLLPLVKDYGPEVGQQHMDQPSMISVKERRSSWKKISTTLAADGAEWYSNPVTIAQDDWVIEMTMWTLVPVGSDFFTVFWNESESFSVSIEATISKTTTVPPERLALLRRVTQKILQRVHGIRMLAGHNDFPVLFQPCGFDNLEQWLRRVEGSREVASFIDGNSPAKDFGLVKLKGQNGRSFLFRHIGDESTGDGERKSVVVTLFPRRKDFLHRATDGRRSNTTKLSFPMDECTVENLPAQYDIFAALVPSILHKLDTALVVQELQENALLSLRFENTLILREATSAPAAREETDYNRLEYLGDSILKYCTVLQVVAQHTTWPEAYLSFEKDRIVRNSNLAVAATKAGLDEYILTQPFTGNKWRPPYLHEYTSDAVVPKRKMSTKVLADVVEAVIGASFVDGGLDRARSCIATLLPNEIWYSPNQCIEYLTAELVPCNYTNRELLERLIGHKFEHPTLLVEAITHVTFPHNRTGMSYERLEFLGDSVLDLIIVPRLYAHARKLKHWELHSAREAIVNGLFLGYCCLRYTIDEETFHVEESGRHQFEIAQSSRSVHLYDFFRATVQLTPLRNEAVKAFQDLRDRVEDALQHGNEYPWPELIAIRPPKFLSDIVESVLGALFIDTGGDLSACEAFVEKLGIFTYMNRILDDQIETKQPKERIGVLAGDELVQYRNSMRILGGGKRLYGCTICVANAEVATVVDCGSKEEAEAKAAYNAIKIVEARKGGRLGIKGKRAYQDDGEEGR